MVIDDKGGEIVYKDIVYKEIVKRQQNGERNKDISDRGRNWHRGERYDKGKGSIKILSTQVGGKAHELVWCIWMCISYGCL